MNEYLIYTGEGTTQNPNGDDVGNFQVLGVACQGETAEAAIGALAEELGEGDPESEADAALLGFNVSKAVAVQTITKAQQEAIRLLVASTTGDEQPCGAELEEAIQTLREMASGFTAPQGE